MKVLILGVSGMLGSTLYNSFSSLQGYETWGTVRSKEYFKHFLNPDKIINNIDVLKQDDLIHLFTKLQPEIVINCVGIIKQQRGAKDPLTTLPINSILSHRLSNLCRLAKARLILVSTDCVFSGKKGNYLENDIPDAIDLYGRSKLLGEIHDSEHVFTMRTSIIGHELNSNYSLVDWFLSQTGKVNGYSKAIFSGFPTVELANIIKEYIIPKPSLYGIYHISASPINKYKLLHLVKIHYQKEIEIIDNHDVRIDRSLNSDKFKNETGYNPPSWEVLIQKMFAYKKEYMDKINV